MSTTYHTDISVGAAANASVFNAPLGTLDAAIVTNSTAITGLSATVTTLQNSLILGGAAVTLTNGAANAAQKVVTVDSSAQFVAGCYVEYSLVGGVLERNVVDTVDSSTQITLLTNIGTGGIADNSPVSVIPLGFARAEAGVYRVENYGAVGDGATDDTAAFQAAIAAVKARTVSASKKAVIELKPGANYLVTDSLDLTNIFDVVVDGGTLETKITYADADATATDRVLFDCLGSGWLTFRNFTVQGDTTDIPAVCISLGRSDTSANAGLNTIDRVHISGYWSLAAIYNISAELTTYRQVWIEAIGPDTATVKYGIYVSGVNDLSVGSHVTRSVASSCACQWIANSNIGTTNLTQSTFIPIYFHTVGSAAIRDTYVFTYDSMPAVKIAGSNDGIIIDNLLVEGDPDKSIHFAAYSGAGSINDVTILNTALGTYAATGIYSDADTTITRLLVRNCTGSTPAGAASNITFAGDVEDSDLDTWWSTATGTFTAANFLTSNLRVRAHTLAITAANGSKIYNNVTGSDHYYHLSTGLRIGTVGNALLAEINDIRLASAAWAPGAIADGASAKTYIDAVFADDSASTWFCQAHYAPLAAQGWMLSAYAAGAGVCATLLNLTGGAVTPTGTLSVVAWKITAV